MESRSCLFRPHARIGNGVTDIRDEIHDDHRQREEALREDPAGTEVFNELSGRFLSFVDVLAEVAEKTRLTSPLSVVRLYERWAETGSPRAAALLAELGITPIAPAAGLRH